MQRLAETMKDELVTGNGLDKGVNIGPLINSAAIDKVSN